MPKLIVVDPLVPDPGHAAAFHEAAGAREGERSRDGTHTCPAFREAIRAAPPARDGVRRFAPQRIAGGGPVRLPPEQDRGST